MNFSFMRFFKTVYQSSKYCLMLLRYCCIDSPSTTLFLYLIWLSSKAHAIFLVYYLFFLWQASKCFVWYHLKNFSDSWIWLVAQSCRSYQVLSSNGLLFTISIFLTLIGRGSYAANFGFDFAFTLELGLDFFFWFSNRFLFQFLSRCRGRWSCE